MSTNERTPEELEAALQAEKAAADAAIENAGTEAGATAAAQGASQEDVNRAVEKARKEEKDKLYPQIQALKDSFKEVQDMLREERAEAQRIKDEAEQEKERRRQEKLSDSEKMVEAVKRLEEKLEREREAREASDKRWQEADNVRRVEDYRKTQIAAANGEIIEDIVRGDSVAEIDRTVAIAKARYAEFAERFKNVKGDEVRRGLGRTSASPDTAALEEQELEELQTAVDRDKYMQDPVYREKIKATLERAYAQQAGRA